MSKSHARRVADVDPDSILVRLSPEVRNAFGDLAAAIHFSEHFDADMRDEVKDWAVGKPRSIRSVLVAFPCIAEETSRHIRATGDKRAEDAWRAIGRQMLEKGFTLVKQHKISR
jgi:hypothetical protein